MFTDIDAKLPVWFARKANKSKPDASARTLAYFLADASGYDYPYRHKPSRPYSIERTKKREVPVIMQETPETPTAAFLAAKSYAVAGASRDRRKYGNQVFHALLASGRTTYPLNPTPGEVEGHVAYASVADLPDVPESLSIVTPPAVTRQVIEQAIAAGVKNIWMQPGAEDSQGSKLAREAGINVIDDGSCVLVSLALERPRSAGSGV